MNPLPLDLRYFATVLQVRAQAPEVVDLVQIAKDWPQALAVRLLAALPTATAVASYQAIPSLRDAARVSQLLRTAGLDEATDEQIFKPLQALHAVNPARAFTLRRAMEWAAQDSAFWPARKDWPEDEAERAIKVALAAERDWKILPLPCTHRLPAPQEHPDHWPNHSPNHSKPVPGLTLPDSIDWDAINGLRAGIEWLHLWRLDTSLAHQICAALPTKLFETWLAALDAATDPQSADLLPRDLVLLEHLQEERAGKDSLTLLEVYALLKGVSEPPEDENWLDCDIAQREIIRDAVVWWLDKAALRAFP